VDCNSAIGAQAFDPQGRHEFRRAGYRVIRDLQRKREAGQRCSVGPASEACAFGQSAQASS
jgi:hypothetical protein